jgi:hypothetical protein
MGNLTDIQIGSIISGMISSIPIGISGILTTIVDQQVYFAEQITGNNISTSSIAEMYQPGIISLAAANVMELMEAQGIGTKSVSIGELSITKGMVDGTSKALRDDGINKLKAIGERVSYYQCWG